MCEEPTDVKNHKRLQTQMQLYPNAGHLQAWPTHLKGLLCPASYSKMSTANSTSSVTRYRLGEGESGGDDINLKVHGTRSHKYKRV
eukprot:186293-Pelagomonas_calceolata.AAC.1